MGGGGGRQKGFEQVLTWAFEGGLAMLKGGYRIGGSGGGASRKVSPSN